MTVGGSSGMQSVNQSHSPHRQLSAEAVSKRFRKDLAVRLGIKIAFLSKFLVY